MLPEPSEYNLAWARCPPEGHNALPDAVFSDLKLSLDLLGIEWQQIAALFQVRDCFPHHPIAEMSLSYA